MNPSVHYYNAKKYCPSCRDYVRYLQSIDSSFCVECGSKVRLFSTADKKAFLDSLVALQRHEVMCSQSTSIV